MNTPKDSTGGCCPPPPCSVFPSDEEAELYKIEKAVSGYKNAIKRNRDGWEGFRDREAACPKWLRWLYWDRSPIPPPLPRPLPARWEIVAKRRGWL